MITAILMASGYSRRFRTDKLLMTLNDRPIIEHMMQTISQCRFDRQILIQRGDRYTGYAVRYGFQCFDNPLAGEGQAAAVRLGTSCSPDGSALMFFNADQPGITAAVINRLIESQRHSPDCIIVPTVNGQNKSPTIFPAGLRSELQTLTGDMGGRTLIQKYHTMVKKIPFIDEQIFFDVDTREDYLRIRNDPTQSSES